MGVTNGTPTGPHPLAPQAWENVQIYLKFDKKNKCKDHLTHD